MNIEEWKKFTDENIMTKTEVQRFIGNVEGTAPWSETSYKQAVYTGKITPVFDRGERTGRIRLFYKKDIEKYKKNMKR